jgi:ketosteroid isomerase-like protein
MKASVLWIGALLATGAQAGTYRPSEADAIAQRDRELNAAIVRHDVAAARGYYDDAFVLTTSAGKRKTKASLLAEIGAPGLVLAVNEMADVDVRIRVDTAVLTGILHQQGTFNGKPFDARVRVTDTWVRDHGQWRILAGHASAL